jgi:hypothetical protein
MEQVSTFLPGQEQTWRHYRSMALHSAGSMCTCLVAIPSPDCLSTSAAPSVEQLFAESPAAV